LAYGQLSEFFGEKTLELDIFMRSLDFERLAVYFMDKLTFEQRLEL